MRLWETRGRYVPNGKLRLYLLRIAHNLCVSRLRSPESKVGALDTREPDQRITSSSDIAVAVRSALSRLPDDQRVVFLLHEYSGLSYAEIADTLAIAPGTVASRKHSAVQALSKLLAPLYGRKEGGRK